MSRSDFRFAVLSLGILLPLAASAGDWRATAERAVSLLGDGGDQGRTKCMAKLALAADSNDDRVVNDFFNIQQTAGGLPKDVSFGQFLEMVSLHFRDYLGKDIWADQSDGEFVDALVKLDENTVKIFGFLNANVHQAAPGDVHKQLWNHILDGTHDSASVYSCYSGVFVDQR